VRREHVRRLRQAQVDPAHDPGDEPVRIGGRDHLGLPHRAERFRAVGPVPRPAVDEDGVLDAMAAAGVGPQFLHHVAVVRAIPQVVVRVADDQAGLEYLLHDHIMRPQGRIQMGTTSG
jgi:hypothetical protein